MTIINIQLSNICAGGGHGTLTVSGAVSRTEVVDIAVMQEKIAALNDETILAVLLRLKKAGLTPSQFRASMLAGFTVTL